MLQCKTVIKQILSHATVLFIS